MSAPQLLPLDRRWYRELLAVAALVGAVVGVLGLVYLGVTGAVAEINFGEPRTQVWSCLLYTSDAADDSALV